MRLGSRHDHLAAVSAVVNQPYGFWGVASSFSLASANGASYRQYDCRTLAIAAGANPKLNQTAVPPLRASTATTGTATA